MRTSELTPLMIACIMGKLNMVKLLVKSARKQLKPELFKLFIDIKVTCKLGGNNALLYAISSQGASNENLAIVQYLISEAQADPDSMNDYKVNCLILASKKAQHGVIDMLIKCGVELGYVDKNGNNALHIACQAGHTAVVKKILNYSH